MNTVAHRALGIVKSNNENAMQDSTGIHTRIIKKITPVTIHAFRLESGPTEIPASSGIATYVGKKQVWEITGNNYIADTSDTADYYIYFPNVYHVGGIASMPSANTGDELHDLLIFAMLAGKASDGEDLYIVQPDNPWSIGLVNPPSNRCDEE